MHKRSSRPTSNERGIALITTFLVLTLMSALLVGFTAVVMSDQRFRQIDRDRARAFYAAMAGLERLTSDLGDLFFKNVAPTAAQVNALSATPPVITDVTYTKADGTSGYVITQGATNTTTISSGPYTGLMAFETIYTMDSTARTTARGEAHLQRQTETVAIPVFQFGIFSDVDLSIFAGPNFDFGGRVHTNGNLFLAEGAGATLTLRSPVTAVQEVIRKRLQNNVTIAASGHTGTVSMAKSPNTFGNLLDTQGSLVDGVGSAQNEPTWHTTSLSTFNAYIRNGRTGAKPLNLPVTTLGGTNNDIIRRPAINEDVNNVELFNERFFKQVSVRILLSDTAADITNLPTVTATAPVQLDGNWKVAAPNNGTAYGPVDGTHPPIARSPGPISQTVNGALAAGVATIPLNAPFPAGFAPGGLAANNITLTVAGVPAVITCTGRTITAPIKFTGCGNHLAAPVGSTITTTVDSVLVTANVTTAALVNSATIRVDNVAGFGTELYWLNDTPVTCQGNSTNSLLNCVGTPAAANGDTVTTSALSTAGIGTIGGFIKVEIQTAAGPWQDVTMQILNYGIAGPNLAGQICDDPTPNAILRIERFRDNGGACDYGRVGGAGNALNQGFNISQKSIDYWPNVIFDAREAVQRDVAPAGNALVLGGVMHYISLDVRNLSLWLKCTAPYTAAAGCTGTNAKLHDNNGYSVYFSDRRNNRNAAGAETGEFGWEDFVNPGSATGAPDGALNTGEDVNGNALLDIYGATPRYNTSTNLGPMGAVAPLDATATPRTLLNVGQAQVNRHILFRRALKLITGGLGNIVMPGLTIATENPVYVHGDWNMAAWPQVAQNVDNHAATSVIADAVTLLSNAWSDSISFTNPYASNNRVRSAQSYYRLAIIAGKGPAFNQPAQPAPCNAPCGNPPDFGTDGGAHNFLRYLESGNTVNYVGSIATFYFNRQAVGTYKCCATVYGAPTRNYAFDTGFLNPALLPPGTPVFRDLNTIGFFVENRPNK